MNTGLVVVLLWAFATPLYGGVLDDLLEELCLIESPVRGLRVDGLTPFGFTVEWDTNWLPNEMPYDIKVKLDGQEATPRIPWWMMMFKKGAGFSNADHEVLPDTRHSVTVSQKSSCGKWSSRTISVHTPPFSLQPPQMGDDDRDADVVRVTADAEGSIRDINDDYTWTERPVCRTQGAACQPGFIDLVRNDNVDDPLALWDPKYDQSHIAAILDDGQSTYILTLDGSPVLRANGAPAGVYDPDSGVTVISGPVHGLTLRVGDHLIEVGAESAPFGSAPGVPEDPASEVQPEPSS